MRISDWSSDVCSSDLLALMECLDAETRELRYVLCAVGRDGEDYVFTPFGHLAPGNPFNAYLPPAGDRKSVVSGKRVSERVDLGDVRIMNKKTITTDNSLDRSER